LRFDEVILRVFLAGIFVLLPIFSIIYFWIFPIVQCITERKKQKAIDKLPILSTKAKVVAKRTRVFGRRSLINTRQNLTATAYYVTFETDEYDRVEFHVDGSVYGKLIEGDVGMLTYQGERYKDFQRRR
jgi:hypothetical protein